MRPTETGHSEAYQALSTRYQQLVLLNLISLEFLSDKPFVQALDDSCNVILGLTGARFVSVHFTDPFGQPFCAHAHGDNKFKGREISERRDATVIEALRRRELVQDSWASQAWLAAPLIREAKSDEDGALALGFASQPPEAPDREKLLLEIGRLLHRARLAQLDKQRRRVMAAVAEQSPDAIFITDLESRIVGCNPRARELFDLGTASLQGKPLNALAPESEAKVFTALTQACDVSRGFETVGKRPNGTLVPLEATATVLRDESGAPFGVVQSFRDITKRKEMERLKSEFVTLVSHELRTPLAAIEGFTQMLLEYNDEEMAPEKRREHLQIMLAESQRLGRLVTNFLDLSKMEAGGATPQRSKVDLTALAARIQALFQDHPSKAAFNLQLAEDARAAWADEEQLYRALVNLCSNAFKYSPPAGIVTLAGRRTAGGLELSVADQGPGIGPEVKRRLFERFFRGEDKISRQTEGTGLGLAITKGIVEAHGGGIEVESAVGKGSRFVISLPQRS